MARAQETVPSDPYFPQGSYALGGGAWGWYRTHATEAWDVTQGDPGVTIAILDTGLKPQALDFGGQLVGGYNVLNGSTDTSSNAGNHGTYVAGVAGLAINNASGNAGYCPGCKIMPVQVGTDSGANYSSLATGITWAVDHGARVLNLSRAGPPPRPRSRAPSRTHAPRAPSCSRRQATPTATARPIPRRPRASSAWGA